MINLRETEIRDESTNLVVESHRVSKLIKGSANWKIRTKLVNAAFKVSSSIAISFITLQNDKFEIAISQAMDDINAVLKTVLEIEGESLLDTSELEPLKKSLGIEEQELQQILAASRNNNLETLSPKLERACI